MPEMTAPAGNAKPEIGMVTVIPDELKKLARLVVRGFYNKYIFFCLILLENYSRYIHYKLPYLGLVLLQVPKCFVPVQIFWASPKL